MLTDPAWLMLSIVFGALGTGYIMYARNAAKILPALAGVALLIVPFFFSSAWTMTLVCTAIAALPFVFREL